MMKKMRRYDGKIIGEYNKSAIYINKNQKHYFVKYQGFGLSVDIIDKLVKMGLKWVYFRYVGAKRIIYRVDVSQFACSDLTYSFGDDLQKFVPVKNMKIVGEFDI